MDIKQSDFLQGFVRLTADAFRKGWHERNGGNLSYRIRAEEIAVAEDSLHAPTEWLPIGNTVPELADEYFLVTGSGKYMRNVELAPEENAAVTRGILAGEITDARADVCLMNAGAAIYIGGAADSIADGIAAARRTIADGSALRKLEDFIKISQ